MFTRGGKAVTVTPQLRAFFDEPKTLIVMKANVKSRVHRRVYLDYVGVKRFDADGNAIGEFRILGLFTSTAYTRSIRTIPYLRRKVDATLRRAGFDPDGHSGKALVNVLESYPRDELFQIDEDTLYEFALAILQLEERPRVRVLARRDRFDRFVSVLVYVPRERYNSKVRARIGAYLAEAYKGHVSAFYPTFPEGGSPAFTSSSAARTARRPIRTAPRWSRRSARSSAPGPTRSATALAETQEPGRARALFERYGNAFSEGYREAYSPADAVEDIQVIESLSADRPLGVDFYPRSEDGKPCVGLKVWSHGRPIPLSERVPVLENMGFRVVDERTFEVGGEPGAWLHDMALERADGAPANLETDEARSGSLLHRGDARLRRERRLQRAGDDGRSAVARRGAGAHHLALPAADSRALFAGLHVGDAAQACGARGEDRRSVPRAVRSAAFVARQAAGGDCRRNRGRRLGRSTVLDEDRIVRRFVNAVQSAIRTNYYQLGEDGQPKQQIAIKFASRKLDGVPRPAPLYEIFVYSPRVEGVHMRFGKVARGGIRWSDRPQDFRTEVLGLVKAQQVKNAVIVPVGSKGGYVPKHLPVGGPREAIQAEGTAAYKIFISTLLDITDNLDLKEVVPPDNVVRHDDDDPYLVVAADKGTATFSDIANGISEDAQVLARRCLRVRRLGRLRPQGHGHHRARRVGVGEAAFPRDGRRHHPKRRSPRSASATCRATCSATACCARRRPSFSRPSTIATSSSIPIPTRKRASPSASGCSICRARAGRTTTRS